MEQVSSPQRDGESALKRFHIRLVLGGAAIVALLFLLDRAYLARAPLPQFLPSGTPRVTLDLIVRNPRGEKLDPQQTRIGSVQLVGESPKLGVSEADPTPTAAATPTTNYYAWYARATPTPREPLYHSASFELRKFPFAASLYIVDGASLLAWIDASGAEALSKSALLSGALSDVLATLNVRAEDLDLEGAQGFFLRTVMRDVVGANGSLHYDMSRGRSGFVLAFERAKAPLASRILPALLRALGKREYFIPRMKVSVVELLVGVQQLFIAEVDGQVLVAGALPPILNALEVGLMHDSLSPLPGEALIMRVRSEAFLDNILPLVAGSDSFPVDMTVLFDKARVAPGEIRMPRARVFDASAPELYPGVLASLPRDAFVTFASNIAVPQSWSLEEWKKLASGVAASREAPAVGGIGFVWDIVGNEGRGLSDVGVAIARADRSEERSVLEGAFSKGVFTEFCADKSVFLASTSLPLLTRMREGCERQNLSVMDIRTSAKRQEPVDVLIGLQAAPAILSLLETGLGSAKQEKDQTPQPTWMSDYLAAVERVRAAARQDIAGLPGIYFEGQVIDGVARLKGFSVENS